MALWICYDGLGSKYHFEERKQKIKDADEWERKTLNWDELSVGAKMFRIIRFLLCIVGLCFLVALIQASKGKVSGIGIDIIYMDGWKKTLNIYSIVTNLSIICIFFSVISIIQFWLIQLEHGLGDDAKTICRIISNVLKYVGIISCGFVCAENFGVDMTTVLASLGIIGFGVTFGAQELIKDMISGLFILLEGNYKVGDMLLIDGNWFWVKAIGVRTTKVEAFGKLQVINNSQMTKVINIQNAQNTADCDVKIRPEYDYEMIKKIFDKELPLLKQQLSSDISTPELKGIQTVEASGYTIRIRSYCPPLKSGGIGRFLRKEVKRIMDQHGILLAYDSYVIQNRPVTPDIIMDEMKETISRDDLDASGTIVKN